MTMGEVIPPTSPDLPDASPEVAFAGPPEMLGIEPRPGSDMRSPDSANNEPDYSHSGDQSERPYSDISACETVGHP